MLKNELENVIRETHKMLEGGIKVYVKDFTPKDTFINGIISGTAFMISTIAIQEIRNAYTRSKNKKWFQKNKTTKEEA